MKPGSGWPADAVNQDNKRVRDLSLQDLEGGDWGEADYNSSLVREVHRLRRVPLHQFRIKDLRLMIGQEIGLTYLVPLALDHLAHHPLAEATYYHGDLLQAVAKVGEDYWRARSSFECARRAVIDRAYSRSDESTKVDERSPLALRETVRGWFE